MYSNGLSQAAQQFQGQRQVTSNNAMSLIQTLLGGGQAPVQQQQSGGVGDLLGSLLGGGQQQQQQTQQDDGLDMGDILKAGLSFMNTKSQGGSNLEAIVNAVVSSSASNSGYRQQSGSIVTSALLQAVQGFLK